MPFWYAMAEGVTSRYIPEIVIINIDPSFLSYNLRDGSFERLGILRPFYSDHEELQPIINKISAEERYLVKSNLYSYNSSFYYLLRPFLIRGVDGDLRDKGWKPIKGNMKQAQVQQPLLAQQAMLSSSVAQAIHRRRVCSQ